MSLERDGYAIVPRVFAPAAIDNLVLLTADLAAAPGRGGVRNLLGLGGIRALAASRELRDVIEPVLGPNCFAVRAICFDKTPAANWKVPWHQDLMVAVRERPGGTRLPGVVGQSRRAACRTTRSDARTDVGGPDSSGRLRTGQRSVACDPRLPPRRPAQ